MAKKLNKAEDPQRRPTINNWPAYERVQPTSAVTFDEKCDPPLDYDQTLVKSDQNDSTDVRKVLQLVPKRNRANAVKLLDSFEHRPTELTFDGATGVIFANQNSIPNSNFFKFFPLLFKKRRPSIPGFADFVNQLHHMGLSHLISYEPQHIQVNRSNAQLAPTTLHSPPGKNWWYIGP